MRNEIPLVAYVGPAVGLGLVGVLLLVARSSSAATRPRTWRDVIVDCARRHAQERTLYQWGGGHGGDNDYGLDCSGLVIQCARQAGIAVWKTSNMMWQDLPPPEGDPEPGDLALYGTNDKAFHVRIVEAWHPGEGRAEVIGAEGRGPAITTPEKAIETGSWVKRVSDHRGHLPFLGWRTLAGIRREPKPLEFVSWSPPS